MQLVKNATRPIGQEIHFHKREKFYHLSFKMPNMERLSDARKKRTFNFAGAAVFQVLEQIALNRFDCQKFLTLCEGKIEEEMLRREQRKANFIGNVREFK